MLEFTKQYQTKTSFECVPQLFLILHARCWVVAICLKLPEDPGKQMSWIGVGLNRLWQTLAYFIDWLVHYVKLLITSDPALRQGRGRVPGGWVDPGARAGRAGRGPGQGAPWELASHQEANTHAYAANMNGC